MLKTFYCLTAPLLHSDRAADLVADIVIVSARFFLPGTLRVWRRIYSYWRLYPQSASSEVTEGDQPCPGVVILVFMKRQRFRRVFPGLTSKGLGQSPQGEF